MDDLEFNEFYKALQNQFQALFERAQEDCWLVCIPCSTSLPQRSQITPSFAEAHLLEPSRMLRDEYWALVSGKRIHWKLNDSTLVCTDNDLTVKVLAEELAYNKKYNQYKMFVIDRPLVGGVKAKKEKGVTKEELLVPRHTVADHKRLLQCFQKHTEIISEVNKRLEMFKNSYMILGAFLMDASKRLETLLKQGYSSYMVEHSDDERLQDRRVQEAIWFAVESHIMASVHSKVYAVVCGHYQKEDRQFLDLSRQLRSNFTPSVLNLPTDYHCQYPTALSALGRLPGYNTPLEKLHCLQEAMDSIYRDVNAHFKARLRLGEPSLLQSDDLIPLLSTILVQANLRTFVSDVSYIELFHWSPSESDKLSYVLVTFRASLEYIRGPDAQAYLPKPKTNTVKKSSNVSPSSSSPSPSHSALLSPLFNLHNEPEGSSINETLSKLSKLKVEADRLEFNKTKLGPIFGSPGDTATSSKRFDPS